MAASCFRTGVKLVTGKQNMAAQGQWTDARQLKLTRQLRSLLQAKRQYDTTASQARAEIVANGRLAGNLRSQMHSQLGKYHADMAQFSA
jgi:hypothetical protein